MQVGGFGMSDVAELIGLVLIFVGGLWSVYHVLAVRIESQSRDLAVVRESYVRRDDFLRVLDRLEKKLDKHLELITDKLNKP